MSWMHCLNCGWQGENNAGKSEKVTGGLMLVGGLVLLLALKSLPAWIGIVLLILGVITLLMGVGAAASMACPHCQSTDIKRYKPSLESHGGAPRPPAH